MSPGAPKPLLIDDEIPTLVADFDAAKPAIIGAVGGPVVRAALQLVWPVIKAFLPGVIRRTYLVTLQLFAVPIARLAADLATTQVKGPATMEQAVVAALAQHAIMTEEANVDARLDTEIDGD